MWGCYYFSIPSDLFNQAICESGSELTFWAVNGPESHPETYGEQVAESFGCLIVDGNGDTDVDAMVDCLRQVDSADIVDVGITCTVSASLMLITLYS